MYVEEMDNKLMGFIWMDRQLKHKSEPVLYFE